MFNILQTTDIVSDQEYFTKHIGPDFSTDPANKFTQLQLEDGTKSVTTKIFKSFGTKASWNDFWNTLPDESKADKVMIEPPKEKIVRPEVEMLKEEVEVPEDDLISEPAPAITDTKKASKSKK